MGRLSCSDDFVFLTKFMSEGTSLSINGRIHVFGLIHDYPKANYLNHKRYESDNHHVIEIKMVYKELGLGYSNERIKN